MNKIRNYERYFNQVARLNTPKTETQARIEEKPEAGEFWLLKGYRKTIFKVAGDKVVVRLYNGPWCDKEETLAREDARVKYSKLLGLGWVRW